MKTAGTPTEARRRSVAKDTQEKSEPQHGACQVVRMGCVVQWAQPNEVRWVKWKRGSKGDTVVGTNEGVRMASEPSWWGSVEGVVTYSLKKQVYNNICVDWQWGAKAAGEKALPIVDTTFPVSATAIFLMDKLKAWDHGRPWLPITNWSRGHRLLLPNPLNLILPFPTALLSSL